MDFSDLRAVYVNCTRTPSPGASHTQLLMDRSVAIMEHHGVRVTSIRAVDHDIAPGVYRDMTEHGQHLGYTIPPQADAGWMGEAGPGPSYGDDGAGFDDDFTNRNTAFMTHNLMHVARMLKDLGGFPTYGNQRTEWDVGQGFDHPNPEHR